MFLYKLDFFDAETNRNEFMHYAEIPTEKVLLWYKTPYIVTLVYTHGTKEIKTKSRKKITHEESQGLVRPAPARELSLHNGGTMHLVIHKS